MIIRAVARFVFGRSESRSPRNERAKLRCPSRKRRQVVCYDGRDGCCDVSTGDAVPFSMFSGPISNAQMQLCRVRDRLRTYLSQGLTWPQASQR